MGSSAGKLNKLKSETLLNKFKNEKGTLNDLLDLGNKFIDDVKNNTYEAEGWPKTTYGVSKMLVNSYAKVLGRDENVISRDI